MRLQHLRGQSPLLRLFDDDSPLLLLLPLQQNLTPFGSNIPRYSIACTIVWFHVNALFIGGKRSTLLATAALLLLVTGCSLFTQPPSLLWNSDRPLLPPIRGPRDAIGLYVVYVSRPAGDRLLGEELWANIDEIANLDPDTRQLLKQNGLRIGVCGQHPPPALQTLLGLKSDFTYEPEAEKLKRFDGRSMMVESGGEATLRVTEPFLHPAARIEMHDGKRTESTQYEQVGGQFLMTASRMPGGWARVELLPQVIYEQDRRLGWESEYPRGLQEFPKLRCSFELSPNEMIVVTGDPEAANTLGQFYYCGGQLNAGEQWLMVIRLADVSIDEAPSKLSLKTTAEG